MAYSLSDPSSLAACTIISRNYLSYARVLAQSFFRHEPGGRFYLLVVDRLPAEVALDPRIQVLEPDDLALPYFAEMTFKYDVTELSTAVKPTLLALLLNRYGEDPVLYFDPDILITGPLDELKKALDSADVVLTPHLLDPIPLDGRKPAEPDILIAGAYNLGFLALRKSCQTESFLQWWEDRLRDGCVVDVANGLMTDQKWVDLVPGFCPSTRILRDPTYNVAYWNIHSRLLEEKDGQFLVNGRPLTFFHFSGFNPANPSVFSKHQDRTPVIPGTALAKLLDLYVEQQRDHGFQTSSQWSYGYSRFDNSAAISFPLRRAYRNLDDASRAQFGDPFHAGEPGTFFDWATTPAPDEGRLSPFLQSLYRVRADVAHAFPDVYGKDREAFLTWALETGPLEMGYDPDIMRIPDPAALPIAAVRSPQRRAAGNAFGHSAGIATLEATAPNGSYLPELDQFPAFPSEGPRCSILIPVHNNGSLVRQCLEALLANPPLEMDREIVVVDDGSTDATPDLLAGYGDQIRVVRHPERLGLAAACNNGVEAAAGEFLVFLNPDAISHPGWLDALVRYADRHRAAAAVGSKLLFPDGTVRHAGMVISQDCRPRPLYTGFPADHPAVNQSRRVQAVSGACMLVRRQPFDEVERFDPIFRNGYEDVDLCLRLGACGYEVHYCHESVLTHLENCSGAPQGMSERGTEHLFLDRWENRVTPDEIQFFLADGLLRIDNQGFYPLSFSLSPLLGVVQAEEEQFQAHQLLAARSRQVYELFKQTTRLELRLRQAEFGSAVRDISENDSCSATASSALPTEHRFLFRGEIRWLSQESSNRLISILLPVKNGAAKLRDLLPRLASQRSRHPVEIVAVDSGSTDDTVAVLRQFRTTAVAIDPQSFNHGLTRNLAAQYARGDVFVFLNQSTLPADDYWLANLVAPLDQDPNLAGVCGRVLPRPEADLLTAKDIRRNINASTEQYVRAITDRQAYQNLDPHNRRLFLNFHTLSAAIRAEVFRRLPFREANFAEDLIWGKDALEAGFKLQYEPSAVAFHSHNYSLLEVFRRLFDDGVACRAIVGKQLRECDILPKIVQEFRDDWRYLEQECRLDANQLEDWRLIAVVRRTAQVLGLWIGMDWEPDRGDLLSHLSLTERIKAGLLTEAGGGWRM
jgi:GT2 family glycosyltransferase